jgi:hypothetical protein
MDFNFSKYAPKLVGIKREHFLSQFQINISQKLFYCCTESNETVYKNQS